jgi:hypothetical protein
VFFIQPYTSWVFETSSPQLEGSIEDMRLIYFIPRFPKFYFHIILLNCISMLECIALLYNCMKLYQ